jgi:Zn-dependent peptidase ImmA (M78 family)/DNA-binding XRE family transcriptional regulator
MLFPIEHFAQILQLARESRGLNQTQLADLANVTQGTISFLENRMMEVNDSLLTKIATALNYPVSFFERQVNLYNPNNYFWRKRSKVSSKSIKQAEALMNIYKMGVETMLKSIDLPDSTLFSWDVTIDGTPEEAARQLRKVWRLPKGRIDNLTTVAENNGVLVVHVDYGVPELDGLNIHTIHQQPIIFLNRDKPADRMRLNLAHELGHLILHCNTAIGAERDVEAEAFAFASELLMPADEIRPQLSNLDLAKLADLKRHWKVSMAAILMWGTKLNLVPPQRARSLRIGLAPYRLEEPANLSFPRETPKLLQEVIDAHLNELGYTMENVASLACLHSTEFQERFMPYHQDGRVRLRVSR